MSDITTCFPLKFQEWGENYHLVMSMLRYKLTDPEKNALTHHVLRQFSYNAQFSRAETDRLELSGSPFSTQDDNPYLRSSLLPWSDYVKGKICKKVGLSNKSCKPQSLCFIDGLQFEFLLSQQARLSHIENIDHFLANRAKPLIEDLIPLLSPGDREAGKVKNVYQLIFLVLPKSSSCLEFSSQKVAESTAAAEKIIESLEKEGIDIFQKEMQNKILSEKQKDRIKDQLLSYFVICDWLDYDKQTILLIPQPHHGHRKFINELLGNHGYKPDTVRFTEQFVEVEDVFDLQSSITGALVLGALDSQIKRAQQNERKKILGSVTTRCELEQLKETLKKPIDLISLVKLKNKFEMERQHLNMRFNEFRDLSQDRTRPWVVRFYSHSISSLVKNVLFGQRGGSELYKCYFQYQATMFLKNAFFAALNGKLPKFIQAVQSLVELCQLDLSVLPFKDPNMFHNVVAKFFPRVHLRDVDICSYAMKGFSHVLLAHRAFMLDESNPFRMQIFNQNYFELLDILEAMEPKNSQDGMHYHISKIREEELAGYEIDLLFLDQHPNNAVEPKLFSHDLENLLAKIFPRGG